MKRPNFAEEKKLWKKGFKFVVGLDEAGRGPLAGPVTAAAVAVNPKHEIRLNSAELQRAESSGSNPKQIQKNPTGSKQPKLKIKKHVSDFDRTLRGIRLRASNRISDLKIRDSKQLSAKQREEIYEKLIRCKDIVWGIGRVSEKVIDKINILEATKLAMKKAVDNLQKKINKNKKVNKNKVNNTLPMVNDRQLSGDSGDIDFLLIDGNFELDLERAAFAKGFGRRLDEVGLWPDEVGEPKQKSIIGADEKVFSCCVAGIIAKVTRDRLMQKYHKKYPEYGFGHHKGYPTRAHFVSLKRFGPCKIHRRSFRPVKSCVPSTNFRKIS